MKSSARLIAIAFVLAIACGAPGVPGAADQKPSPRAPAPTPQEARPESVVKVPRPAPAPRAPLPVSRTPGPLIAPGSPIEDRATIAPFPVPGDTSRDARERAKVMNVPRAGVTALEPLPRGIEGMSDGSLSAPLPHRWKSWRFWAPDSVWVAPEPLDVLPEMLEQPAPEYPKAARDAGIQGTVLVRAHVRADGTVGETHVARSIPALDAAAVETVKRLRFKPGMSRGKPVATWVGVPVRFTLH